MMSRRARIALRWFLLFAGLAVASLVLLAWYGARLVDTAMRSAAASSSAQVLAGPLVLRRGDPWSVPELARSLSLRGLVQVRGQAARGGEFTADRGRVDVGPGEAGETGEGLRLHVSRGGLELQTASGIPLAAAALRPAVIGTTTHGDVARREVPLTGMAPHLLTAVVDTEDQTFLDHPGLSARGLLRAAVSDLLAGGVRQGGSTITQQLAKILMLRPSRTVGRKVLEAWLATLIEYRYDKRTILEAYLNRIYLGQDGGRELQGVEVASRYYFGKGAGELREEEAALLAGLIAAPNRFDPFAHAEAARRRRGIVLEAMARQGHLETSVADRLATTPLPTTPRRLQWPPAAQAIEAAVADAGDATEIATTIDVDFQWAAVDGVQAGLAGLEREHSRIRRLAADGDPLQAALVTVALDGRVLALVGSRSAGPGEFNRALAARRQIGSLVKPFVAVEALAAGRSLDDVVLDEPLVVATVGAPWQPRNSDGRFRGPVTFRRALVESLNVPMVRIGLDVTVSRVAAALERLGFNVADTAPAILLGAVEATPLEVARAYASLVNRGLLPSVSLLAGRSGPGRVPVLDAGASRAVVEALQDVVREGTAAALAATHGGRLAAKTGTSDDRRDSWFVALREQTVTVVWLGTDANRETGLYGATGAMEVWRAVDERLPAVWRR